MKNNKKSRVLGIAMILIVAVVFLGGATSTMRADVSLKILAKGLITLKFTDFDQLGFPEEEQTSWKKAILNTERHQAKDFLRILYNVEINDEQAQKIVDKMYKKQKDVLISTKILSEEEKIALVELSVQPIDVDKMIANAKNIVKLKIREMSKEERINLASAVTIESYLEAIEQADFKSEPTVIQVKCSFDENRKRWLPEDGLWFGEQMGKFIWGE